jgi:hypothetical protein
MREFSIDALRAEAAFEALWLNVRLPTSLPIQIFQPNKTLFIVVGKGFLVGITRIIIAVSLIARELDGMKHH